MRASFLIAGTAALLACQPVQHAGRRGSARGGDAMSPTATPTDSPASPDSDTPAPSEPVQPEPAPSGGTANKPTPPAPKPTTPAPAPAPAPSGPVTAAQLMKLTEKCTQIPGVSLFKEDHDGKAYIPWCKLKGAIFYKGDMDIDCDGGSSALCKSDPYYQSTTAMKDSTGRYVDASKVPFVVFPLDGSGLSMSGNGLKNASVAAVIYNGKLIYAPIADRGPKGVNGEASAALAEKFGISGHPIKGGVNGVKVTYIFFSGDDGVVKPVENFNTAQTVGEKKARQLLEANK